MSVPKLIEVYSSDASSVYACWEITVDGKEVWVSCTVGVPPGGGAITAWYEDPSDWCAVSDPEAALAVITEHAVALYRQHV